MTKFQVNPKILDWVIKVTDLEPEKIKNKIEKYEVLQWKEGTKEPTLNQLQNFAQAFHVPFGYLFLDNPPVEKNPTLAFRTMENRPVKVSRGLRETIYLMQTRQEWMRDELKNEGSAPLSFVGVFSKEKDSGRLAEEARKMLCLSKIETVVNIRDFYNKLKNKFSSIGILVMQNGIVNLSTKRKLDVNEMRAFVLLDNYAPLIFINTSDAKSAQVFSLIHEFVHILIGEDEVFREEISGTKEERFINQIVEEILMPKQSFVDNFYSFSLEDVARTFHVSYLAAAIRACHLDLISQNELDEIKKKQHNVGVVSTEKKNGGGNQYLTAMSRVDPTFANRVLNSYDSGDTSSTEASHLLGSSLKMFPELKSRIQERNFGG